MKTIIITLFVFMISSNLSIAQGIIEWQNTIGGDDHDTPISIEQTAEGGYIIGGYSRSNISGDKTENCIGGSDYWIVKIESSGNIQWQNTIGGTGSEGPSSVKQTMDGGYILGGFSWSGISGDKTESNVGANDIWIVKTDSSGNILWQNSIGGSASDELSTINITSDGGYILGSNSISDISGDKTENCQGGRDYWIIKIDSIGNIQWQNTIGGGNDDRIFSIQQTAEGGYILGGISDSNISGDKTEDAMGYRDCWIVKTDSVGNILWQNTIGGNKIDELISIQQTTDGGYIFGGSSDSDISGDKTENCQGLDDYWVVKIDDSGSIQWQNTIGGNSNESIYSIQQTTDGGYIMGGYSTSFISGDKTEDSLGLFDFWIVKIDSIGTIQWQNTIGGTSNEEFRSIRQCSDGGYIVGGYSQSDISSDKSENCIGGNDYWIVKLYPDTVTSITEIKPETYQLQIYPNPVTNQLTIRRELKVYESDELFIYNVYGNIIHSSRINNSEIQVSTINYPAGVYVVRLGNEFSRFIKN